MEKAIFFDMDGVLVEYNPQDYKRPQPLHEIVGNHYFQHLNKDGYAVTLFHELMRAITKNGLDDVIGVGIISTTSEPADLSFEQRVDKKLWVWDHMVGSFGTLPPQISHESKPTLARIALNMEADAPLNKNIILIDDFNKNLVEWEQAGGRGVKYLNGQNSKLSWDGLNISKATAKRKAIETLLAYAMEEIKEGSYDNALSEL